MSVLIKKERERKYKPSPFGQTNLQTTASLRFLDNIHPKFAKHMFLRNSLVEMFAKEKFGGVEMLDLPMCRACERPGAWHDNESCYCFACGTTTPANQTKPLRQWLAQDIKEHGFSEEEMELLEQVTSEAVRNPEIERMMEAIDKMTPEIIDSIDESVDYIQLINESEDS
jgi:hypothetical protein